MVTRSSSYTSRALFWKLAVFYAAYFLAFGIYMPYWPLWLDSIGLTPLEIGWVLAGTFWIKVAAQPSAARFADKKGKSRALTTILMALSSLGFCYLTELNTFWMVLMVAVGTAACYQPVLPVMESVVLRHAKNNGLDYGKIRLWGSVTFIIGTTGTGWWLETNSTKDLIWLLVFAMALVAISCAIAPNQPEENIKKTKPQKSWKHLFTLSFILFLITAGLIQISHSVLYGFGTLHWRNLGHSETMIGLFWSVGVLTEIILFAFAGKYKNRLGPLTLLTCAALAGVIRWPLLAMFDSSFALFALQTLHCLTFGAAHLGAMAFLSQTIPNEYSATGQSLYYTLVGGIFSGCMLPISGVLFTKMAGDAFYLMGALSALALISLYLLSKSWKIKLNTIN